MSSGTEVATLAARLRAVTDVLDGAAARVYAFDASLERGVASLVALPRDVDEVQAVLAVAGEAGVAVVPRGAGTGYAGGATPAADELVVATAQLRQAPVLDAERGLVTAGAGVIAADVDAALRPSGHFLPQLPSSALAASIGGCVATCAGGSHSYGYGSVCAAVESVEYVTAAGERRVVGVDEDPLALELLIGSEGTLGVISAVTIRGVPLPAWRSALRIAFERSADAIESVAAITALGPGVTALDLTMPGALPDGGRIGPAYLYVDVHAADAADGSESLDAVAQGARGFGGVPIAIGSDELGAVRLRDAIEKVRAIGGYTGRRRYFLFDAAIGQAQLAAALDEIEALAASYRLPLANAFHAGDGTLHPAPYFDAGEPEQLIAVRRFWSDVLQMVASDGGGLSGEHGVGLEKIGAVAAFHSARAGALMRELRARHLPHGPTLNPRKGPTAGAGARPDDPLPERLAPHARRGLVDVPRGVSVAEVFEVCSLPWVPLGAQPSDELVELVLAGWPVDAVRGGRRLRDSVLGFWFRGEDGVGYLGSDVRKDVAHCGLRRAVASGAWDGRPILGLRLALEAPRAFSSASAGLRAGEDAPLAGVERAVRRLGAGAAVFDAGRVRLAGPVAPRALAAVLAHELPGLSWGVPAALDAEAYRRLLFATGPVRRGGDVRAGTTAWFAGEWVVACG